MYGFRSSGSNFGGSGRFAVARLVSAVGSIFAVIEVVYAVLIVAKANSDNGAYQFFQRLADPLALFFPGLFSFSDANLTILANYGAAALFWVVVSGTIARVIGGSGID